MEHAAFVALTRFGLGPRPGERAALKDPRGWLRRQATPAALPPSLALLPHTLEALATLREHRRRGDAESREARAEARAAYDREVEAHLRWRVDSEAPFAERWYACWANHFTVSITRKHVTLLAGPFERYVVRVHAFGRFEDLLLASTRHPAMLLYLDNVKSTGPDSVVGRKAGDGLNENLAREVLELHTLGVDGGYAQADVEALAAMLTGWTLPERDETVTFQFQEGRHQPGTKTLLGKSFPEAGEAQATAALKALAAHPSTARNVARRLCRHFVADDPPASSVERISKVFLETGGDLAAVARAVIDEPAAWDPPLSRIKRPSDLVTGIGRLLGGFGGAALQRAQADLGEVPYAAKSPAGWSDLDADWVGPQAVLDRIELARRAAERATVADPAELAGDVLGGLLSAATARAVKTAPSAADGLALLLASPELQRR